MAESRKDDVVEHPANKPADTGSSRTPSPEAAAATPPAAAADHPGSAAEQPGDTGNAKGVGKAAQAVEAEVIDPEVIDPEEASETEKPATESELVKAAQAEAADWQDKYLRLHAEWDTYRRRTTEQREAEKARATEKLVSSLLPVIDDFERTIDYARKNGEGELLSGVEAVHTKLMDTLTKDGVVIINPAGRAFDALEAQAVATVEKADVPDETVAEVYQKGYKMGDKVLRPAMVTVTTGGPKREPSKEDSKK